jgi:hypothetical protein
MTGSFRVTLDDGREKKTFELDHPHAGLHVPPRHWIDLSTFSRGAVCCVLASDVYDDADYLRDYSGFKAFVAETEVRRA